MRIFLIIYKTSYNKAYKIINMEDEKNISQPAEFELSSNGEETDSPWSGSRSYSMDSRKSTPVHKGPSAKFTWENEGHKVRIFT